MGLSTYQKKHSNADSLSKMTHLRYEQCEIYHQETEESGNSDDRLFKAGSTDSETETERSKENTERRGTQSRQEQSVKLLLHFGGWGWRVDARWDARYDVRMDQDSSNEFQGNHRGWTGIAKNHDKKSSATRSKG